jgi:SWI/SNF-related matrix-associated actin-dependent regulator of chromatin subfamily A3
MGLGKTIQIISLINANPLPTTLIVVPVALLAQWHEALIQLGTNPTPSLGGGTINQTIIYYHGSSRKKHHLSATDPTNPSRTTYSFRPQQNQTIIALTTYGEISRPKSRTDRTPASPIHSQEWSRIVFDEAHHLRNPKTNVHQAALQLSSKIKWLLTGTPIQNSRRDFYALCSIIGIPQHLYSGPAINLKALASNYLIKRTKQQLQIPMPDLKEHIINVPWTNQHERELARQLHTTIGMEDPNKASHEPDTITNNTTSSTITTTTTNNIRIRIPRFNVKLVEYLRARQLCVHPGLLKTPYRNALAQEQEQDTLTEDPLDQPRHLEPEEIKATENFLEKATNGSSKLTAIIEHIVTSTTTSATIKLTESTPTRKLVFCEFRKEMDYLETALAQHNIITGRVDGATNKQLKDATISSPHIQVLLLQVRTCSEGLNLQQYSDIYIVTPQWNPTIESQAICRAYRIGQKAKQVNVFRFVMEDTSIGLSQNMETCVLLRQSSKREEYKILA